MKISHSLPKFNPHLLEELLYKKAIHHEFLNKDALIQYEEQQYNKASVG